MVNFTSLVEEQKKLARKVVLKDEFEPSELFAGVEVITSGSEGFGVIVVCNKDMEVVEQHTVKESVTFPYKSGFRAFREGPVIGQLYSKLKNKPSLLFFNGHGILHPYKTGLAAHMGVLLDQASIGIAKENHYGEQKDDVVYVGKEKRAQLVHTREHANPIFVSPGHKISLKTAVKIVQKSVVAPHKLPEPLHIAHKLVKKLSKS